MYHNCIYHTGVPFWRAHSSQPDAFVTVTGMFRMLSSSVPPSTRAVHQVEACLSVMEFYGSQNSFKLVKSLAQHLWVKHVESWLTFIVVPYLLQHRWCLYNCVSGWMCHLPWKRIENFSVSVINSMVKTKVDMDSYAHVSDTHWIEYLEAFYVSSLSSVAKYCCASLKSILVK